MAIKNSNSSLNKPTDLSIEESEKGSFPNTNIDARDLSRRANDRRSNDRRARPRRAQDIDSLVGERLRYFRKKASLTQKEIGDAIGVSFKQIRKYEIGENRISASALFYLSHAVNQPIDAFYSEIENAREQSNVSQEANGITNMAAESEAKETIESTNLVCYYHQIESRQDRKSLLDLVRAISNSEFINH